MAKSSTTLDFFNIFKIFLKIGMVLLGGGYVILPLIREEFVEKRNWLREDEVFDFYCVSQCVPGVIAINLAVLIGLKLLKTKGMLASVLGICTVPFVIILLIAGLYENLIKLPFLEKVFWGVNIAVIILIYLAFMDMFKNVSKDLFSLCYFIFILFLSFAKLSPSLLIIFSIFVGILLELVFPNAKTSNKSQKIENHKGGQRSTK